MKLSIFVFLFVIIVSCIKIFSGGSNQPASIIKEGQKGINLAEETNYGRIEKDVVEIQQKTSSKSIIVNENLVQFSGVFKEHKPDFVDPYQDNDSLVYEFTEEIYDSSSYLDESTEDIQPSNSVILNSNDDEFLSNQSEEEYGMLYEAMQIDDSFILLDE